MPAQENITEQNLTLAIQLTTIIFMVVALAVIILVIVYNQRKRKFIEERFLMKKSFDAELVKSSLEIQETTLQTIATDLHDNIGQLLSLNNLTLASIDLSNLENAKIKIDNVLMINSRSIKELRLLAKLMNGQHIRELGLIDAISYEILYLKKTDLYNFSYTKNIGDRFLDKDDINLIIFRIFQEIINNIIKHAKAKNIDTLLECDDLMLKLTITDDGIGFDFEQEIKNNKGMGLSNIQKRVSLMNGKINIVSTANNGTSFSLEVPYK